MSSDTLKIILLIKLLYLSSRLYFYELIGIINPFGKLSEQKKELPCKHESEVNKGRQGKFFRKCSLLLIVLLLKRR